MGRCSANLGEGDNDRRYAPDDSSFLVACQYSSQDLLLLLLLHHLMLTVTLWEAVREARSAPLLAGLRPCAKGNNVRLMR
jgi:hypothetical protein